MKLIAIEKPKEIFVYNHIQEFLDILSKNNSSTVFGKNYVLKKNNRYVYLSSEKKLESFYEVDLDSNNIFYEIKSLLELNNVSELNTLNKIRIITLLKKHISKKETISLLDKFNFAKQENIIRQCEKTIALPNEFLDLFNTNQSISLKQLYFYTRFDQLFLKWFTITIYTPFKLTFSQLNIFLDQLNSLQYRSKSQFDECIEQIKTINMAKKESQNQLKKIIFKHSNPIIYKENKRVQEQIDLLNLPDKVSITWDKSLENKELKISITCNKNEDMKLLDLLKNNESKLINILKNIGYENS